MPPIAPINVNSYSIGSFLTGHVCRIPELQRPFAWGPKQAEELVADIQELLESREPELLAQHFFGTIVLLSSPAVAEWSIIDGQQRLTTTTLLIGLIRQAIDRLGERAEKAGGPAAEGVKNQAANLAAQVHSLLWLPGPLNKDGKVTEIPRLYVSPEIASTYTRLVNGERVRANEVETNPEKNLIRIAEFFNADFIAPKKIKNEELVMQLRYLQSILDAIKDRLLVVSLETASQDAGYGLFESLNDRGVPLNALDLVKVWMLSRMNGEPGERQVAQRMRDLSSDDSDRQLSFFGDYFRVKVKDNPKMKTSKAFAHDARARLFRDPKLNQIPQHNSIRDRIVDHVDDMWKLTPVWECLRECKLPPSFDVNPAVRDWIEFRLRLLVQELGHTGAVFALLLGACENAGSDPKVAGERFGKLVHMVERFFFRYKVICSGHVSALEQAYFSIVDRFAIKGEIDLDFVCSTLQSLIDERAPDELFKVGLAEKLLYSPGAAQRRIRYFLFTLDDYSFPNPPRIHAAHLLDYSIEHVAPQNPAAGMVPIGSEYLHHIGNLVLLDPWWNGKLSNKPFEDKLTTVRIHRAAGGPEIEVKDSRDVFDGVRYTKWESDEVMQHFDAISDKAMKVFKLT